MTGHEPTIEGGAVPLPDGGQMAASDRAELASLLNTVAATAHRSAALVDIGVLQRRDLQADLAVIRGQLNRLGRHLASMQ